MQLLKAGSCIILKKYNLYKAELGKLKEKIVTHYFFPGLIYSLNFGSLLQGKTEDVNE